MKENIINRTGSYRPETESYSPAMDIYASEGFSGGNICRPCRVSINGFTRDTGPRRQLKRTGRSTDKAGDIMSGRRGGQCPETHAKYRDAVAACGSLAYIEYNISQIAREFGLDGSNLGRQLRTHYPEVLEFRERTRQRLGLDDHFQRGTRPWCKEQYAEAVELLRSDRYVTVREAARICNVSCSGLEQHLIFYHKELVGNRIRIRRQAVGQQCKGKITGRGTIHAPSPEIAGKYAGALELYRTTPLSARKIAAQTGVSAKGFYKYLQTWHKDLLCARKGIAYKEGKPVDWSSARRYNPATAAKYAGAIARLKEGGISASKAAAECGLHPECFRQYLKEHEPELHAGLGMIKTENGKAVSARSMERYREAIHQYETAGESLRSIARRFGLSDSSLGQFIKRNCPGLARRRRAPEQDR